MGLHRQRTHPQYVEGCFGCKIQNVNFGTVPGAAKDERSNITAQNNAVRDMDDYRTARQNGEQPDQVTRKGIEGPRKRAELFNEHEAELRSENPPEKVQEIKKALTNTE